MTDPDRLPEDDEKQPARPPAPDEGIEAARKLLESCRLREQAIRTLRAAAGFRAPGSGLRDEVGSIYRRLVLETHNLYLVLDGKPADNDLNAAALRVKSLGEADRRLLSAATDLLDAWQPTSGPDTPQWKQIHTTVTPLLKRAEARIRRRRYRRLLETLRARGIVVPVPQGFGRLAIAILAVAGLAWTGAAFLSSPDDPATASLESDGSLVLAGQRYNVVPRFGGILEAWYGRLDRRDNNRIHLVYRGWAGDANRGRSAERVVAFLDGAPVAVGPAGEKRPDIARSISRGLVDAGFRLQAVIDRGRAATSRLPAAYAVWKDGTAAPLLYGETRPLFEAAEKIVYRASDPESFKAFLAAHQLVVQPGEQGLELESSGPDPQLLMPRIPLPSGAPLAVRIEISTPKPTKVQLYFSRHGAEIYSEEQSRIRPVAPGRSAVYFLFWAQGIEGRIRLDPGRTAGRYQMHTVEIRHLTPPSPAPR